jgi:hypothetical protein
MVRNARLLFGALLLGAFAAAGHGVSQAQDRADMQITVSGTMTVLPNGNGRIAMELGFDPPRGYDRVKAVYPNLYVLFRDFGVSRASFDLSKNSLQVSSDDGERKIRFRADVLGAAACKNGHWYLNIARQERFVTRVNNRLFTTAVARMGNGWLVNAKYEYILPGAAVIHEYSADRQQLSYRLPAPTGQGPAAVDVHVRYKKRLMAAVYKIYGDPEAALGSYWGAKTVFNNTGRSPIRDLRITYRLGEYTEESVPEKYSLVPPGGAVVDVYYPIISARVAQLKTRTPTELRIRYEYVDAAGRRHTDQIAQRLEILGVNQFEYSNLSDEDTTGSWFDSFNNAPLLSAFVTRNDEVVRQFAGMVSEVAGGVSAATDEADARRWLKAAYDMQMANNIVYQTPSGFLTPERSSAQDIKFPRDVFRDKSGTCIDLAITYASLAESVGLKTYLMLVPGHCFAVVQLPNGNLLKVENTGLGGGNRRSSFDKAVADATETFAKAMESGVYYLVDVQKELGEGRVTNPELPSLPPDFLEKAGIRRRR